MPLNKETDQNQINTDEMCHTKMNKQVKVKLATLVEGDPKAPFSSATTPRCRGERYSIPWIAPPYPWSLPYNAEC